MANSTLICPLQIQIFNVRSISQMKYRRFKIAIFHILLIITFVCYSFMNDVRVLSCTEYEQSKTEDPRRLLPISFKSKPTSTENELVTIISTRDLFNDCVMYTFYIICLASQLTSKANVPDGVDPMCYIWRSKR